MAALVPVVLDYETFWSSDHSLTKMNPIEYVMHPNTEIISMAIKIGKSPTLCTFGEDAIAAQIRHFDWSDKLVIAHNNSGFDAMISAWRFGMRPAMWGCTLAMAKPHHAKTAGGSLKALAEHYQLGVKDSTALLNTKGRHMKDFSGDEITAMREYNIEDVELCNRLFKVLHPLTSKAEMKLIDMTIRMLVEPRFEVDKALLRRTLQEEQARKNKMLLDLASMLGVYETGMDDEDAVEAVVTTLGSAAKFGQVLKELGVDIPMKISPTTGKPAPALAKTDEGFVALTGSDDPIVAAAANARLGVKSTLLESRITSFIDLSESVGGRLPMPLLYFGGHTGRWSGHMKINVQNMPRVSGKPGDCLRNSLRAPEGYKVVVADLSGIELRVNHFLWKVPSSMALFQADPEKADLYKDFASSLYGKPVSEISKAERQIGKVAHLGLGFSAGAVTFVRIAKMMGGVDITLDESREIVKKWRKAYAEIKQGWRQCGDALPNVLSGAESAIDAWGLCRTAKDKILLPVKGRFIHYPALRQELLEDGDVPWVYGEGRNKTFLSPGKVCENCIQSIARDIIAEQALEIKARTGYTPTLMVHDELVYVVPEDDAEQHLATLYDVMRTAPKWWPELVLWAEGGISDTYGGAK